MAYDKVVDSAVLDAGLKQIADAIREKGGTSGNLAFPSAMAEAITAIEVNAGGSIDGVHTVTFMNHDGTETLYERYVADGDDCADVVERGLIDAPTKESTAQYDFSHSGWALTNGGDAEADALSAVTADRTVYAAFVGTVRYYTVTYYDSDGTTVLKTESLVYGSMPSYTPSKDGVGFGGWTPALASVTSDASYTAAWVEQIKFENASWAQIAAISQSGEAEQYFAIGDTKILPLAFPDATVNVQVRIIGFNHDNLSDGSGKAGISIALAQGFEDSVANIQESKNYGKYYVWKTSATRTLLNSGAVYTALPSDLRSVLKSVTKISNAGYGDGFDGYEKNALFTTEDEVWMLSATELGLDACFGANYVASGQGEQYPYYTSNARRTIKTTKNQLCAYPTRSMHAQYLGSCVAIHSDGTAYYGTLGAATSGSGYPVKMFGFCI